MKPKVELVEVEDESVFTKMDWAAVLCILPIAGAVTLVVAHVIVLANA